MKTFFQILYTRLINDKPEYNNNIYYFIIGGKDAKGYFILRLKMDIKNEALIYTKKDYRKIACYGGDERYTQIYNILKKYNDLPINTYSKEIEQQITHLIHIFDIEKTYNPVGLPLQVEIFQ